MDYTRPANFESDFPDCEFLRKPIKEAALLRCLRGICSLLDMKQKANTGTTSSVNGPVSHFPTSPRAGTKSGNSSNKRTVEEIQPTKESHPLDILVVEGNIFQNVKHIIDITSNS